MLFFHFDSKKIPKLYRKCNYVKNNELHTLQAWKLVFYMYRVTYEVNTYNHIT